MKTISKTQALLATLGAAGAMAVATTASADTHVTVQSGDTVAKLANQYHSSVEAIRDKNQLADVNKIWVGQQLDIPNDDQDQVQATGDNAQVSGQDNQAGTVQNTNVSSDQTTMYQDHNGIDYSPMRDAVNYSNSNYQASGQTNNGAVTSTSAQTTSASNQTNHGTTYSPAQAVSRAQSQVGTPYVWGGNQPGGFDCSGLVQWSYGLPASNRTTYTQQALGAHHYDVQNAQAGDLYFWGSDTAPHHVAIATGNGGYIQAPQPGQNVQNGNINWYHPNYYVSMQ